MSIGQLFRTADTGLQWILRTICTVLFGLLVALACWQVFTRLVLHSPSAWSEEAARYTFVWVSLIGISIATAEKADVVMEIVVEKLPLALQRVCDVLASLCSMAFVIYVMVLGGAEQAQRSWGALNPVLPLTEGQLYLALPVSGVLLSLFLIRHIVHALAPSYRGTDEVHVDDAAAGA